jgi:hypothetical protein
VDSFKRTLREKGVTEEQLLTAQSLPRDEPAPPPLSPPALLGEPGTGTARPTIARAHAL